MLEKLEEVEKRYGELEEKLADPGVISNRGEFTKLSREHKSLAAVVASYRSWRKIASEESDLAGLLDDGDPEMRAMASAELPELRRKKAEAEEELRVLLLPKDPNDDRSVIVEIRAGTGGEEAGLFAADLFRMYTRYAELRGWRMEILDAHPTGVGGYKEIICSIDAEGAYSRLKFEGGVHRVQRVPQTEAQGRIHTSAVTVAVLPEADEVDVAIDEKDLRIDVFRSSGPGGQSVNTTDSAVRVTHIPSGLVVSCQDEKSQHKNKAKALKILRARLLERAEEEQRSAQAASRRSMVGTGDRSERIRTYNFPQNRVTDHRINLTTHALERILEGELDAVIDPLVTYAQAEALKAAG
ncbi:MAG: peptide chain release factor 1 [Deltaproteobacteria bacterium]|nr:peptide chain release factor 1 [Deltaproteobacteria bacterium]